MGQQFGLGFDEIGTSRRRITQVRLTHRWREPDSNHQSREGAVGAFASTLRDGLSAGGGSLLRTRL